MLHFTNSATSVKFSGDFSLCFYFTLT